MKAAVMHHPEMQIIWLWMARSDFTDGFLELGGHTTNLLLPLRGINRTPWGTMQVPSNVRPAWSTL